MTSSLPAKTGRLHWLHWLIISLSLCLTIFAWQMSKQQVEDKTQQTFNRQTNQIVSLVQERMQKYADALWSGVAYVTAVQNEFDHKDWAVYSKSLNIENKYPGINGIGVIYEMPSSQLPQFEKQQQKERPFFKAYPQHKESTSWPITFIEPLATNRAAVGLDMAHEANRFTAAKKAAATGTAQITGPITLVQDKEKTPGFLFYAPFYKNNTKKKTFLGLVYAPFIFKNLMNGVLEQQNRLVSIHISDKGVSLFNELPTKNNAQTTAHRYHKVINIPMYGRTWTFDVQANQDFFKTTANSQPTIILATGIIIDTLLLLLFIALARSNRKSIEYANQVTHHLQNKTKELDKLAHFDALTELPNRRSFLQQLNSALELAQSNKTKIAVLFIDIDNFKFINDSYGHQIADKLLVALPQLLLPLLNGFNYFLSRLSGDEFGLMITNLQNKSDINKTIETCLQAINTNMTLGNHQITPSISIGISCYPENGINADDLIANADLAMYRAKQTGKNNYKFYDKEIDNLLKRQHALDTYMRDALANEEFNLVYQPQIDIKTDKLVGMEALLRWQSPELGPVSPEEFIPVAEANGLIINIGKWVINQACLDFNTMKQLNPALAPMIMAINTSARELETLDYVPYIQSTLSQHSINPSNFEFEVTESALMQNITATSRAVENIKALGASIALDDFGTGYSSMKYLKSLAISTLKIDKFFVADMLHSEDTKTIVNAMIQLAHGLKLNVLAEGVETVEQLEYLKANQCDFVQGYYFSKPLSLHDFIQWTNKS